VENSSFSFFTFGKFLDFGDGKDFKLKFMLELIDLAAPPPPPPPPGVFESMASVPDVLRSRVAEWLRGGLKRRSLGAEK